MGFKALLRALGEEKKNSHHKEASDAGVEARRLKREEKQRNSFFGQLKQLEEFKQTLKQDIKSEENEKAEAVNDALAGFMDAQQEQEMLSQGFHPDSSPSERMALQAMNLVSHHLTGWTDTKTTADPLSTQKESSPPPASLEDLASAPVCLYGRH